MLSAYNKSMLRIGGFSLVELLIGISVFLVVVSAFFGAAALSTRAVSRAGDRIQAAFLVEEGVEGVRFLRDVSWKNYIENQSIGYDQCLRFNDSSKLFTTTQPDNVLLMHFDETSGTVANDYSGLAHSGTITGATLGSSGNTDPNLKTSFSFDGTDDYITVSDSDDFNFISFTVAGWIKTANAGSNQRYIVTHSTGAFGNGWTVYLNNNFLAFLSWLDGISTSKGSALNDNSWHHVAIVRDTTNDKVIWYIDSVAVGSQSTLSNSSYTVAAPIYIGKFGSNSISAYMDEIALYNRALTAQEIKALYDNNAPACGTDELVKFKRTVKFQNVCRNDASNNISEPTSSSCASGNTLDPKTKHARVTVKWGDFSESTEFYFANLFSLWQSIHGN